MAPFADLLQRLIARSKVCFGGDRIAAPHVDERSPESDYPDPLAGFLHHRSTAPDALVRAVSVTLHRQQRAGLSGKDNQDQREYEAFYHEALFKEFPGTGKIQHSTRVQLIDGALGYYYALSAELRKARAAQRDELLARRAEEVKKSGRDDLGDPPKSARRQGH